LIPFANTGIAWLAVTLIYLAVQPAWGYFARWSATWSGRPGVWAASVRGARCVPTLAVAWRLVYCVGAPYLALLLGVADARRLGLAGLPLWPQLPLGMVAGLAGVGLLAWSWGRVAAVSYRRGAHLPPFAAAWQALRSPWGWASFVAEVLCLQMSWAFVRGAAIRFAGLYAGVFLGLALLGATWLLRPGRLEGIGDAEVRAGTLLTAGLALVTSLVFLYAENLWLCGLVHALGWLAAMAAARRAYARAGRSQRLAQFDGLD